MPDSVIAVIVGVLGSGVLVALINQLGSRGDRAVTREGTAIETAADVVTMLREELEAERDRRSRMTQALSDRVAALEARLEAADERAERYAAMLWEARHELGKREQDVRQREQDIADLKAQLEAVGERRNP